MSLILIAAIKDLKRRLADPAALLMWIGLPIVIGLLMSLIGGDGGPAPKAQMLVVDEDRTFVSGLVASAGRQGQLAQFLEVESVPDAAAGRARMDRGEASALLILPKGFQDGVLREQPTTLTLVKNPSQQILPRIIEETLNLSLEAIFYVQRLFGEPVRAAAGTIQGGAAPSDETVASISRAFNERMRKLEGTLVPPVLVVETPAPPANTEARPSFWALFLPGLLFMGLMFTAQGMSLDVWTEQMHGTLRRTLTTQVRPGMFLVGKLLAGIAIMVSTCLLALVLGVAMFGVPITRAPIALVWTAFAGAALFSFLVLLQVISTNARGAQLLSSLVVFPLIMIGGSFFPFEAMPAWMVNIGRWTPNGLAVMQLKQLLYGRIDMSALAVAAVGIGVPAAAAFGLAVRRVRGTFATS